MWKRILEYFADSPSQQKVIKFILENGFGISKNGKAMVNNVEITASSISRSIHTDRRVVETALKRAGEISELHTLFSNIRVIPDITNIAKELDLSVITIIPKNAENRNIVASAVNILSANNLTIRQIFVTDPFTSEIPKLVIILNGKVPGITIEELRNLPSIKSILI